MQKFSKKTAVRSGGAPWTRGALGQGGGVLINVKRDVLFKSFGQKVSFRKPIKKCNVGFSVLYGRFINEETPYFGGCF